MGETRLIFVNKAFIPVGIPKQTVNFDCPQACSIEIAHYLLKAMALPYILLPTEQLRFTREGEAQREDTERVASSAASRQTQVTKQARRARPLSAEDSASIYSYIRAHNKNGLVRWPKARKESRHELDESAGAG